MTVLYRWDCEADAWQSIPLEKGQPLRLGAALFLAQSPGRHCLLLLNGAGVAVNGLPSLPLQVVADRDAIRIDGETVYFSAELPARPVAFPALEHDTFCSRCKGSMATGDAAIQCPRCSAWHHQTGTLACWTYDAHCSSCDHPTRGTSWQPEPLRRAKP